MRYRDFKIVETKLTEAGEVYVIGDSHARAMGGSNNLASDGARLNAIARQAQQVPNGATVYMTGGHNDVAAGTNPNIIANEVQSIARGLTAKDCTVNYILFPEGTDNTNQENMAPTRQAISRAITVAHDLDGCSLQGDGVHCQLGAYRGIVGQAATASTRGAQAPDDSEEPTAGPDDGTRGEDEPEAEGQTLNSGPPYPPALYEPVARMQSKLQELGYSVGSTGVDGKYGPRTTAAVRAFKQDNDINTSPLTMSPEELQTLATAEPVENPTPTGASAIGGEIGQISQDSVTQGKVGAVLDLIAGPESAGRYDAVYPGRRRPEILDMTLTELIRDMRRRGNAYGSSASGRYQYIRTTLQEIAGQMGLDFDTTKFTPEVQDQIAVYHLRLSHGLDSWIAGRMSNEAFLARLSRTWAGIPDPGTGRSFYAGVLDNRAGVRVASALQQLDDIQSA